MTRDKVNYWFDADPGKTYTQAGCAQDWSQEPGFREPRDLIFWIGLDGTGRVVYLDRGPYPNRKEAT